MNEENIIKNYMSHEEPQYSGKKERFVLNNVNLNKSVNNSSDRIPRCSKLNRNLGEHVLFKDTELSSQCTKEFCLKSQSYDNCIRTEENKLRVENDLLQSNGPGFMNAKSKKKIRHYNSVNNKNNTIVLTSKEKLHADKSTYCRPVLNYYNEQFIYKTMERNARLKNLVKKLTIARQREKEKVSWNNYINDLKNKHRFSQDNLLLGNEEYLPPDIIDDYYNTKFSWEQSRFCKNLLQDFYESNEALQPRLLHRNYQLTPEDFKYLTLDTGPFCYPTSPVSRLTALRNQRKGLSQCNESKCINYRPWFNLQNDKYNDIKDLKSSLVQVDNQSCPQFIRYDKGTSQRKDLVKEVSIETNKGSEYKYLDFENNKNKSLINIENKLEYLIENFNSFMSQIRRKGTERDFKCKVVSKNTERVNSKSTPKSNYSSGMRGKNIDEVCEDVRNSSLSSITISDISTSKDRQNKINEILRGDICNKLSSEKQDENNVNESRAVQISIEVPTKDCCTAVTNSSSQQGCGDESVSFEEIIIPERETVRPIQGMTIAVNTDPLSFLGLLRISSDTLKRLLSYMPNFDYLSYLSSLHFIQTPRNADMHYVCKICGADFNSPSKLSDHIRGHDIDCRTRDCCVCRHVVERTRCSLFTCQYCGLQFTRAYCCELHQQSCAKRLGKCHDVSSSLMLLR